MPTPAHDEQSRDTRKRHAGFETCSIRACFGRESWYFTSGGLCADHYKQRRAYIRDAVFQGQSATSAAEAWDVDQIRWKDRR